MHWWDAEAVERFIPLVKTTATEGTVYANSWGSRDELPSVADDGQVRLVVPTAASLTRESIGRRTGT